MDPQYIIMKHIVEIIRCRPGDEYYYIVEFDGVEIYKGWSACEADRVIQAAEMIINIYDKGRTGSTSTNADEWR